MSILLYVNINILIHSTNQDYQSFITSHHHDYPSTKTIYCTYRVRYPQTSETVVVHGRENRANSSGQMVSSGRLGGLFASVGISVWPSIIGTSWERFLLVWWVGFYVEMCGFTWGRVWVLGVGRVSSGTCHPPPPPSRVILQYECTNSVHLLKHLFTLLDFALYYTSHCAYFWVCYVRFTMGRSNTYIHGIVSSVRPC